MSESFLKNLAGRISAASFIANMNGDEALSTLLLGMVKDISDELDNQ